MDPSPICSSSWRRRRVRKTTARRSPKRSHKVAIMNRIKAIIAGVLALIVLIYGLWIGIKWTAMRVYVGPEQVLLITNKFGKSLPSDRITVPAGDNSYKGVREEVLGPGRYFLNPVEYDWEVREQVQIPAGDPHRWVWDADG